MIYFLIIFIIYSKYNYIRYLLLTRIIKNLNYEIIMHIKINVIISNLF